MMIIKVPTLTVKYDHCHYDCRYIFTFAVIESRAEVPLIAFVRHGLSSFGTIG